MLELVPLTFLLWMSKCIYVLILTIVSKLHEQVIYFLLGFILRLSGINMHDCVQIHLPIQERRRTARFAAFYFTLFGPVISPDNTVELYTDV